MKKKIKRETIRQQFGFLQLLTFTYSLCRRRRNVRAIDFGDARTSNNWSSTLKRNQLRGKKKKESFRKLAKKTNERKATTTSSTSTTEIKMQNTLLLVATALTVLWPLSIRAVQTSSSSSSSTSSSTLSPLSLSSPASSTALPPVTPENNDEYDGESSRKIIGSR